MSRAAGLLALAAVAQTNVSVAVQQPGFYGRIDIGGLPPPAVIYPEPVIVQAPPVVIERRPVYLRVPPGHAKNWAKHCHRYAACGQPTYFVQDSWYERVYLPARPGLHAPPPPHVHRHGHGHAHRERGKGHKGGGRHHG
jgi:hypothetical protein